MPASEKVRPACHKKPQQESGLAGWAGQWGIMGTQTKGLLKEEGLSGGSGQGLRQEMVSGSSAVARTAEGPCRGGFLAMWAARPQDGGPSLGLRPGGSHLLNAYYVPGT